MSTHALTGWAADLLTRHHYPGSSTDALTQLLDRCDRQEVQSGSSICTEGDEATEMYLLLQGQVQVLKAFPGSEQRELAVLRAPAMFGHMAMLDGSRRSASCVARGKVVIACVNTETVEELKEESHPVGTNFRRLLLSSLTRQLELGNGRLRHLIARTGFRDGVSVTARSDTPTDVVTVGDDDLLQMAGLLEGWKLEAEGLDDIELVEDEDMRRMREDRSGS